MAAPRPTENLMACIRCGDIPNPRNYMVCEDGWHHLCGSCSHGLTKESSELAISLNQKKFFPEKVLEACCASRNLRKGSPRLLEALWNRSMWRCPNEGKGCSEVLLGIDWDKHKEACKFRSTVRDPTKLPCYFHECTAGVDTTNQLVEHYKEGHGATPFVFEAGDIGFNVVFAEILEKRHLSLIQLNDSLLIFACEVCRETEVLHVWIWNMSRPQPPKTDETAARRVGLGRGRGRGPPPCDTRHRDCNKGTEEPDPLVYNLKLLQVEECDGVEGQDLVYEDACLLPSNLTPQEILKKKGTVKHFKIELDKLFNSCVESTPDGRGRWTIVLKFARKN